MDEEDLIDAKKKLYFPKVHNTYLKLISYMYFGFALLLWVVTRL